MSTLPLILGALACRMPPPTEPGTSSPSDPSTSSEPGPEGPDTEDTSSDGPLDTGTAGTSGEEGPERSVYTGEIDSWPIVVRDRLIDVEALPLVTVLWSEDGEHYHGDWEYCNGGYSFEAYGGALRINQTYCTAGATHYLVVIEAPAESVSGQLAFPQRVSSSLITGEDLPLSRTWFDAGDGTWYTTAVYCAGGYSTEFTRDALQINDTYCVPSAGTRFQVAFGEAADRWVGAVHDGTEVRSDRLDLASLPMMNVYFGGDGQWREQMQYCSGGDTFELSEGTVALAPTWCIGEGEGYQVVLGQ